MSGDHEALPASGVIVASMLTGNTDIALEMIKIGGAALLAYAAGFSNGEAKVKESGDAEKDESYSHPPKASYCVASPYNRVLSSATRLV